MSSGRGMVMTQSELLLAIKKNEQEMFLVGSLFYGSRSGAQPAVLDKLIERHDRLVAEYQVTYGTLPDNP